MISTDSKPARSSSDSRSSGLKKSRNGSPAAATRADNIANAIRARGPSSSGDIAKSNATAVGGGNFAIAEIVARNASRERYGATPSQPKNAGALRSKPAAANPSVR